MRYSERAQAKLDEIREKHGDDFVNEVKEKAEYNSKAQLFAPSVFISHVENAYDYVKKNVE